MPQMQNAQTVALQLEKVRDKLPLLYERDDILLTMIQQRGDVERVSSRNMRLPLQIRPGGKAGLANLDGGDLGRGSGTTYDVAQVTPVFFRHAVEISKSGVTTNVTAVDPFGGTITVDNIPTGTSPNDLIVHDGLSGAQPVSLFGILYHQTNATTGTWLNLNRATYPVELATPHVSGNNSALTPGVVRLAINKVRKSLGTNQVGKLIAYTSLEQEHAWEQLGVTISQIIKEGAGGRASDLDLLFTGEKTMAGVPIKSSINANTSRVDFLDLSHWGRAVMQDIDFYDVGGQTVFPIYGASGGLAAAYIFYFVTGFQVWNDSPRSGAYIDSLAIPSGY